MASEKGSSALSYWTQGVRSLGSLVKDKTTATVRMVSGTTIPLEAEHRKGESFLRTTTDIRDVVDRGDILTLPNGRSFIVSPNPHDMFTATVVSLKTPRGVNAGVNDTDTCTMTSVKRNTPLNMPRVSVPTSMDDVYSAAGSVGKGIVGMVGLGVQAASDLAASAKSYEERVRVYETPIGTLVQEAKKGAKELRLTEAAVTGTLEEVLYGLHEVPGCVVTLHHDSSYAETSTSLVDVLNRGDAIMIDGEAFKVSNNPAKRFHATQLPLNHPRTKTSSAEARPIYRANDTEVCIRVPNCMVSLDQHTTQVKFLMTSPTLPPGTDVIIGGERYQIAHSPSVVSPSRQGDSVENVPIYVPQTPVVVDECLVTLKNGDAVVDTSKSLLALVSRGDFVKIDSTVHQISSNPLKRLTASSLPLDKANTGPDVVNGRISLYQDGARILKAGDTIKLGSQTYAISDDHDAENNRVLPLASKLEQDCPAGTVVFYVGNRYVKATEKAAAAAHRAGAYKVPVGRFVCLVKGSNVLFTDGDLRGQLKKGDQIVVANQSFVVSPNPTDLYARDCIALDRRYEGPSLRLADTDLGHVVAFERGSTECKVDRDMTDKVHRGDVLVICGEEYMLADVSPFSLKTTAARAKESAYATPTVVPDCLVSLAQGSKYAETSSNVSHRIKRGDRVVIGNEIYRVSTNVFYRFTADHVPLDTERVGESVEMDDLQVAAYDGDRSIRSASLDFSIYKLGDRVADIKDDLQKRDLLTKTQKTTDAIGEKMRPGAEKVVASAAMASEKIKDAAGMAYAKAFGATVLK
ncbi:hypothetical protein H310_06914 [Aphanomyces invadans]|uniref:Uncharacterized protein n=1 Tax=Aphanomyces invadans TaxID=157072 RepID=A0A024U652_9STRA|nr:hypothetical protein H310_06914 [Aphanomyces invadans]ETW01357.1 hypothetical protein H310_06914 [Aphanomyces invadans]|eukprot:XP_008870355.1 hypothetical protein H310_06914 [Aphanomyces invadans]